ncbi:MAG: sodium:proton antiporter NhaD, partial [Cellvibrionales bacterium]|nr:sodium:proton antiporter NhaD [Cellvibrionales bacterium]
TNYGFIALGIFFLAYLLVILEEKIHLPKSKPVMMSAALIWVIIACVYLQMDKSDVAREALLHNFLEYAELFFFLLVAMTYINTMMERNVFEVLRQWLVQKGFSFRALFWLTGFLAFFISPVADNLTTALILCAVILAVGRDNPQFVGVSCINIVVAANAGGAFSPFGDITTLMVWQKEMVEFAEFFQLFVPALVNFVIPAFFMQFAVTKGVPAFSDNSQIVIKSGGLVVVFLFLLTIVTAVVFHSLLDLPPVFGMMTGLGYLNLLAFYLCRIDRSMKYDVLTPVGSDTPSQHTASFGARGFDVFDRIGKAEWDTLLFFYGVILSVGGLGFMGYLSLTSSYIYGQLGPTIANVLVGIMSAIVDNIPVMFAVLTMNPEMSHWQWLLVTLTAGVGGSLLSIGSAAGVALMGQARGYYTFFTHLKWMPVIALGYAASIYAHYLING